MLESFQKFLDENGLNKEDINYTIVTDGINDIPNFFQIAISAYNLPFPHNFRNFVDLRQTFIDTFELNYSLNLEKMVQMTGSEFEGTPHRGIDDARNIAKIVIFMLEKEIGILATHKLVKQKFFPMVSLVFKNISNSFLLQYPSKSHYKPRSRMNAWYNKYEYGIIKLELSDIIKRVHFRCDSCVEFEEPGPDSV